MLTIAWVIFAGLTNFNPQIAFDFPPNSFELNQNFFLGLGSALLISVYDYWGYYNVNFFAGEVKNPNRNLPLSLALGTGVVIALYIACNFVYISASPPAQDFLDLFLYQGQTFSGSMPFHLHSHTIFLFQGQQQGRPILLRRRSREK